ncbi:MAG: hypothetical protein LBT66_06025 [Methanobrevibacter sp.]|jgi:hypothetical protein|nr:hypothetical protein [Candidatus Methanovirga meridionalis]
MNKGNLMIISLIIGVTILLVVGIFGNVANNTQQQTYTYNVSTSSSNQNSTSSSNQNENLVQNNVFMGVKFNPPSNVILSSTFNSSMYIFIDNKKDGSISVSDPETEDYFRRQYGGSYYSFLKDDNDFIIVQSSGSSGYTYMFVKKTGITFNADNEYQLGVDLLLGAKIA